MRANIAMKIAKARRKDATVASSKWIYVENNPIALIGGFTQHVNNNPLVKILPFRDDAISLKERDQDYSGVIQPIVFEFDYDTIEHQIERADAFAAYLQCPFQIVYSGNKSIHMTCWFLHFADTHTEYRSKAMGLFWNLARDLPEYLYFSISLDMKDIPKEQVHNVPDISMFSRSRYTRQPEGIREGTGARQKYCVISPLSESKLYTLHVPPIINIILSGGRKGSINHHPIIRKNKFSGYGHSEGSIVEYIEATLGLTIINNRVNPCPVCGHRDCFTVYPNSNSWYCFSSQHNSGGSLINLINEIERR
jgi:hypothetical protein